MKMRNGSKWAWNVCAYEECKAALQERTKKTNPFFLFGKCTFDSPSVLPLTASASLYLAEYHMSCSFGWCFGSKSLDSRME